MAFFKDKENQIFLLFESFYILSLQNMGKSTVSENKMLYSELLNDKIRLLKLHLEEPSMIEAISLIHETSRFSLEVLF